MRRRKYNLYKDTTDERFTTGIESVIRKRQDREGNVIDSKIILECLMILDMHLQVFLSGT